MKHFQLCPLRILVADNDQSTLSLYRKALCPEKDDYNLFPEIEKLASKLSGEHDVINMFFLLSDIVICNYEDKAVKAVQKAVEENMPFAAAFLDTRTLSAMDCARAANSIQNADPFVEIVIVTAYSDISPEDIASHINQTDKVIFIHKPLNHFEIHQLTLALGRKWHKQRESPNIYGKLKKKGALDEDKAIWTEKSPLAEQMPDSLPGLNIREGLWRMGGAWDMYADLIIYFCNDKKDFSHNLRDLIEKKDYKAASTEAHALKGSAATISATKLSNAAKKLEKICIPGKSDKEIMEILGCVEDAFAQVMESSEKISLLFQKDNDGKSDLPRDASPTRLCQLFESLDKNLQEFDPVGSECCIREIKAILNFLGSSDSEASDLVRELAWQISDFNFESAREVLNKLAQKTETIRFPVQRSS